jgi:hypothetical protein
VTEGVSVARGSPEGLRDLLDRFPPRSYARGDVLIENSYKRTEVLRQTWLGYVVRGLVRGTWNHNLIAPDNRATTSIAGDGRWIGLDVFKYGENLFRYTAMAPTTASIVPLEYVERDAPRSVLLHALKSASLHWYTSAAVLGLGRYSLERRTLLLLYDMRRLHPRARIEVRQTDVADLLGVVRQTLHPVLVKIEAKGLIGLAYGAILIGEAAPLLAEARRL